MLRTVAWELSDDSPKFLTSLDIQRQGDTILICVMKDREPYVGTAITIESFKTGLVALGVIDG